MARTELKIGEDGPAGFGRSEVLHGPANPTSPTPMATYRVRPLMKMPLGPDGSLTSLSAEGSPSKSVRRIPLELTMEMRPEPGAPVPASDTIKLLRCVIAVP